MKKKPVKTLWLYQGYAEDQSMSCMVISHIKGFDSVLDALQSLARVFGQDIDEDDGHLGDCKADGAIKTQCKFCPECGVKLDELHVHVENDIIDGIAAILQATYDSMGSLRDELEDAGWSLNYDDIDLKRCFAVSRAPEVLSSVFVRGTYPLYAVTNVS